MAATSLKAVFQKLSSMGADGLSDRELLDRFIDIADEAAFATLVRRHGRMVLGLCRRKLGHGPDADDSFQATFVILARKAKTIRKRTSLASWLHGVAHRVSLRALSRRGRSRLVTGLSESGQIWEDQTMSTDPAARTSLREVAAILDEELQRLPAPCRDALVVCLMEGRSHTEAAQQLGWALGTFKGRLARGRDLLRQRLERRGIGLTGIALSVFLTEQARAFVPATLLRTTVQSAAHNVLSPAVAALAKTVVTSMAGNLKAAFAVLLLGGVTLAGVGVAAYAPMEEVPQSQKKEPTPPAVQAKIVQQPERVDLFGDPLPEGAIMRLGTVRWRHGGQCGFIAFLPGGKSVLTAGGDNLIRVWEYPSGKELRRFGVGTNVPPLPAGSEPLGFYRGAFLPVALTKDGKTVACDLNFGGIRLYEVATGKEITTLHGPNKNGFEVPFTGIAFAFSPDGKKLATVDPDGSVHVWDWVKAKEPRLLRSRPPGDKFAGVPTIAYSPNGERLLTVNAEKVDDKGTYFARLWDPDSGKEIWNIPLGDQAARLPADFSPDGKRFVIAGGDGSATIFTVDTGTLVARLQDDGKDDRSVLFGPDGKSLFTHDLNATVCEWNLTTGQKVRLLGAGLPKRKGTRYVGDLSGAQLALSPDATTLALCGVDNVPHFLDLASGKETPPKDGPTLAIQALQFTPESNFLWTRAINNTVSTEVANTFRMWDPKTGKELQTLLTTEDIEGSLISPDGKYRVQQSVERINGSRRTKEIQVIENATENKVALLSPSKEKGGATMLLAADGKTLILRWYRTQVIEVYQMPALKLQLTLAIRTGYPERDNNPSGPSAPDTMFISPDGKLLAAYSDPVTFSVWDITKEKKLRDFLIPEGLIVHNGAFTPDGRSMAVDFKDGTLTLYELTTAKIRHVFGENLAVPTRRRFWEADAATAIAPDGKFLVQGGLDRHLHIWDLVTGTKVATLAGHSGTINAVAFSPDGKLLASASTDTTTLVWDASRFARSGKAKELTAAELKTCWLELGGDAPRAFDALGKLADAVNNAVPFLATQMKLAPTADTERLAKLIADLNSDQFKTRDAATRDLEKLGELADPHLRKALAANPSLEMKNRVHQLLDKLDGPKLSPETLRQIRAVETLEYIGTPEARQLLQTLSQGAEGARQTKEAQAALTRLAKRAKAGSWVNAPLVPRLWACEFFEHGKMKGTFIPPEVEKVDPVRSIFSPNFQFPQRVN